MNKHKDLGHRLLTPKYFKDIEAFINLANQCGRFKDVPIDDCNKDLSLMFSVKEENFLITKRVYEKITAHTDFLHSTSVR